MVQPGELQHDSHKLDRNGFPRRPEPGLDSHDRGDGGWRRRRPSSTWTYAAGATKERGAAQSDSPESDLDSHERDGDGCQQLAGDRDVQEPRSTVEMA